MALIQDIISAATQEPCDIPSLLRKALVLAARLRNDELKTWVENELNGYAAEESVPEYRRTDVISYGFFADRFIGQATLQIPLNVLPEEVREQFRRIAFQNPIGALVDLDERSGKDGSDIQFPWPTGARQYAQKVSPLQCINAWRSMSPSFIAGVLDTIKTRILMLALELEAADPTAGDVPSTHPAISEARVNQIINTHIHGTVQNFSAGGDNVSQTATMTVQAGDKLSLLNTLKAAGVQAPDLQSLEEALASDEADKNRHGGMGSRVTAWLGNLQVKAARGLAGLSTEVVGGLITAALLSYFGLGP